MNSIYTGRQAVLATQHAKEKAIRKPFLAGLGLNIVVPPNLDTDALGTFTGEIARFGAMKETVLEKARLGLQKEKNVSLAIANEGSFGPHPANPFISSDYELMAFIDRERNFHVIESLLTAKTNFAFMEVKSHKEIGAFLAQAGFPQHALTVKPKGNTDAALIYKGITDSSQLKNSIDACIHYSADGIARIETDMRAHLNPMRRQAIRRLAFKLVRRLRTCCRACQLPGWGLIKTEKGLPCELCRAPTQWVKAEIYGCVKCDYQITRSRSDQKQYAEARHCEFCNP